MNPSRRLERALLGVLALTLTPLLQAQTDHSGTCSGTFTAAGNPHRLTTTCSVPAGETLTLADGAVLEGGNNALVVRGTLNASGATLRDVNLSFQDRSGGTLSRTTFENGVVTISGSSVVEPTVVEISDSTLNDASGAAINVNGTARPRLLRNRVNSNGGISMSGSAAGTIAGNTFTFVPEGGASRNAISLSGAASPRIEDNTFEDDPTRSDRPLAFLVDPASAFVFTGNTICATGDDLPIYLGIGFFADTSAAVVENTTFSCERSSIGVSGSVGADSALRPVDGDASLDMVSAIVVQSGATLAIPPAVTLNGQSSSLVVDGTLDVDGATLVDVFVSYRNGSSGTFANATVRNRSSPFNISGSSVVAPTRPSFQNNTIEAAQTAFTVSGTSQPVIRDNAITCNQGVAYTVSAAGVFAGNTVSYNPEAGASRAAVSVGGAASPLIERNTLEDDPTRADVGIDIGVDAESTAIIRDNAICSTGGDRPIAITSPEYYASGVTLEGNTFPCGNAGGVTLHGSVSTDVTVAAVHGFPVVRLSSTLSVAAGATLRIGDAVRLMAERHSIQVQGTLLVEGAELTDFSMTFLGDSQGTITGSTLRGSGGGTMQIASGTVVIRDSVIEGFNTVATLAAEADLTAEDNVFRNNATVFWFNSGDAVATARRNRFERNGRTVNFNTAENLFSAMPVDFELNEFAGAPDENGIVLPRDVNTSGTLRAMPAPYVAASGLLVRPTRDLVLEPGVIVRVGSGASIQVDGNLIARGTADLPVVFSAVNHSTARNWGGLVYQNSPGALETSLLEYCVVEFATRGITLDASDVPIEHCLVADHGQDGIVLRNGSSPTIIASTIVGNLNHGIRAESGSAPRIEGCVIFGNGGSGVHNDDEAVTINAAGNYWGDDSGPRRSPGDVRCGVPQNTSGLGEDVSDCVQYDPWLRLGPSIEGTLRAAGGNDQSGAPGEILPAPLVVEIRSMLGAPLRDIEVIFSVVAGDAATVEPMPVTTGAEGRAAATIRLGQTPGEVLIAVTARDVRSPLASFLGEANAPCLMVMKIVPGLERPCAPRDIVCDVRADEAFITWRSLETTCVLDRVEILDPASGEVFAVAAPGATSAVVAADDAAHLPDVLCVAAIAADGTESLTCCESRPPAGGQVPGDANQDGALDIADALSLLGVLFDSEPLASGCGDTPGTSGATRLLDFNGDRRVNLVDAVATLSYLFDAGPVHVLGAACTPIAGCAEVCRR